MILKLGMKHQTMELYKVCITHDTWMTLTYLRQGQLGLPMHLNWENCKIVKFSLGNTNLVSTMLKVITLQ